MIKKLTSASKRQLLILFILAFALVGCILLIRSFASSGSVLTVSHYDPQKSKGTTIIEDKVGPANKKPLQVVALNNETGNKAVFQAENANLDQGIYKVCFLARVPSGSIAGNITATAIKNSQLTGTQVGTNYTLSANQNYAQVNKCITNLTIREAGAGVRVTVTNHATSNSVIHILSVNVLKTKDLSQAHGGGAAWVIAQTANNGAAQISWDQPSPAPAGWSIKTRNLTTNRTTTSECWACTTTRVSGLSVGQRYVWEVSPMQATATPGVGTVGTAITKSGELVLGGNALPGLVMDLRLSADTADQWLTLNWRQPVTGNAADTMNIDVIDAISNQKVGGLNFVDVYDTTKRIPITPGSYFVNVATKNTSGYSGNVKSNPVSVGSACSGADACVHIESGRTLGTENLVGQGFLIAHKNFSGARVDAGLTSALKPQHWRFAETNPTENRRVASFAPHITHIISDNWHNHTSPTNGGRAVAPWSNWTAYRAFVKNLVLTAKSQGWSPSYWDLFNEPDSIDNYFSPADRAQATPQMMMDVLKAAYQSVKEADSNAKIVAPSLTDYVDIPEGSNRMDMGSFIRFAAANKMKLDAVSWHENSDGVGGPNWYTRSAAYNVLDHINRLRRLVAQNPAVGNPVIFINEYGTPQTSYVPSWNLSMFAAFEKANIAGANRSCWNNGCSDPVLNGLLTLKGTTFTGTLPTYWTAKAYADMKDATKVQVNSSSSWRLSGLAVRQNASSTIRILLGHHWSCAKAQNPVCASGFTGGNLKTQVAIDWPYASPAANVTIQRIPAGITHINGPTTVSTSHVTVRSGKVTASIPAFADGDVYSLVVTAAN